MHEDKTQKNLEEEKKMNVSQVVDNENAPSNRHALRNPWILAWLGLLGTVVLINFVFISMAFISSPGLVTEDYYEQGRKYEDNVIKMIAAKNNLRWETNLHVPNDFIVNKTQVVRFNAVDSNGLPINNAEVQVTAYRPSDADADFIVKLDNIGPGIYQSYIGFPLKGIWDLKLRVNEGENTLDMVHRLSVAAN